MQPSSPNSDIYLKISYVVLHSKEDGDEFSLFQGFSFGLMKTAGLMASLSTLPASVLELVRSGEDVGALRLSRITALNILPLEIDSLHYLPVSEEHPFFVIICPLNLSYKAKGIIKKFKGPTLLITDASDEPNRETIFKYIRKCIRYWANNSYDPQWKEMLTIIKGYDSWINREEIAGMGSHGTILANNNILKSLAYEVKKETGFFSELVSEYVSLIYNNTKVLKSKRNNLALLPDSYPTNGVILVTPALYKHAYNLRIKDKTTDNTAINREINIFLKALSQQQGYNFAVNAKNENFWSEPHIKYFMGHRANEIDTFNAALIIQAASSITPVVRLPAALNLVKGQLKAIGDCSRSTSTRTSPRRRLFKLNKSTRTLKNHLLEKFPSSFFELLPDASQLVKICSDVPLEWLDVDGVPLMFRYHCSRIPCTPGNLFFSQMINTRSIPLGFSQLCDVLIIRSYQSDDPIKNILADTFQQYDFPPHLKIEIKDIENEDQLIFALNSFSGGIVIFDCHGTHDAGTDIGSVIIGDKKIDTWSLSRRARIPNILFFSACDTHPLDRSHASSANGFLKAGATTVICSLLPVNALYSAVYASRLIYRIAEYVPILFKNSNTAIPWVKIMGGMQRMTYATEIVLRMYEEKILSKEEDFKEINLVTSNAISIDNPNWYEIFIDALAVAANISKENILSFIDLKCAMLDVIKYVQLGNPDKILIYDDR